MMRTTGPWTITTMQRITTVIIIILAIAAPACNELPAEPIEIDNQSNQPITILGTYGDGEYFLVAAYEPGERNIPDLSECIGPDLEARLDDDTVVAYRPGPFCQGDPMWVVTQAQVDTARGQP